MIIVDKNDAKDGYIECLDGPLAGKMIKYEGNSFTHVHHIGCCPSPEQFHKYEKREIKGKSVFSLKATD